MCDMQNKFLLFLSCAYFKASLCGVEETNISVLIWQSSNICIEADFCDDDKVGDGEFWDDHAANSALDDWFLLKKEVEISGEITDISLSNNYWVEINWVAIFDGTHCAAAVAWAKGSSLDTLVIAAQYLQFGNWSTNP